ncbi:MAG: GGDEF domain-containing protein [Betaproteobacteria bacterium]
MANNANPIDVARETLKVLVARRIAPTPANYQRIYHEISGSPPDAAADVDARVVEALLESAAANPNVPGLTAIAQAAREKDWPALGAAAAKLSATAPAPSAKQPWAPLIRDLLRQLEVRQTGVSLTRKRDGLERLLITFGSDASLHDKLQSLVRSWAENTEPAGTEKIREPELTPSAEARVAEAAPISKSPPQPENIRQLKDLFAQALELGVAARLEQSPGLADEARALAQQWRVAQGADAVAKLAAQVKQFWYRLEMNGENDAELLTSLRRLLGLLVNNIGELVEDDQWVSGQLAVISDVINQPLSSESINLAERSFKQVVYKQSMLKHSLREAKATFKNLITVFVERLSEMTSSTAGYEGRIETYAMRLKQTDELPALQSIVNDLMTDTRSMQADMVRRRDEMLEARKQAELAEERVRMLELELRQVSEQVREDQLTGMLNRRGLDDAMQRELSRSERRQIPLCVAILDLDNFKKLNDTYGHQAGDEALVHLSNVVRLTLRPTDIVARYGGEEFIILFGDTQIEAAVEIMRRLQRELTKKFFLHNNERLLITFSAGVAALRTGDTQDTVFDRADKAMYQAKLAGKNRVVTAEE